MASQFFDRLQGLMSGATPQGQQAPAKFTSFLNKKRGPQQTPTPQASPVPQAQGGFYQQADPAARQQLLQTMLMRSRGGAGGGNVA